MTVEQKPYPFAQFEADEFDNIVDVFRRRGEDPEAGFAKMLTGTLSQEYPDDPDYISYDKLKDGTAGVFELFPKFAAKPPEERKLTDSNILQLFAYDMEGRPVQPGTVTGGMKRKALPGAASAAAFLTAAKGTNALLQLNPLTAVPVTPAQQTARVLGPLITGTVAAGKAYQGGEYLTDAILGPEPLILPSTTGKQVFGEVLSESAFFGLIPYGLSGRLNLGATKIAETFTPVKLARKGLIFGDKVYKPTTGFRFTKGAENLVNRLHKEAYGRPVTYLGAEASATGLAAFFAQQAEEAAPGELGPRMVAEIGGGVLGGIGGDVLLKRTVDIFNLVKEGIGTVKRTGLKGAVQVFRNRNENEIANFLLDYIERYGGDVDEIIKNLTDARTADILADYEARTGKKVDLTSGVKSRSPLILALEKSLELTTSGIAGQRGLANRDAVEAFRIAILAAHGTGDQELVRLASSQMKDSFEIDLQANLDRRLSKLNEAIERLRSGEAGKDPATMSDIGTRLHDLLQESLKLDRAKERYLWKNVPTNIMVTRFTDIDGEQSSVPNFIKVWSEMTSKDAAPEAYADQYAEMSALLQFTNRKRTELGLGGQTAAPAVPENVRKFQTMYGNLEGVEIRNYFDRMVDQFNLNEPTTESIQKLAELAGQARGRRRSGTDLSKLYDAKRLALQAERDANIASAQTQKVTGSRVDELSGQVSEGALESFNARIRGNQKAYPGGPADNPDSLRAFAKSNDELADRQMALFEQDRAAGGSFRETAERLREEANLLRARADDIESPVAQVAEGVSEEGVSVGELISMRSKALNIAKMAAARGDKDTERMSYEFASAIERDIDSLPEGQNLAYDIARSYSRALNDTYTRGFAGEVLAKTKTGALKTPPEQLGRQLFTAGTGFLRAQQLDQVGQFQLRSSLSQLLGSQSSDLATSLDNAALQENGFYDLTKLRNWVSENEEALNELPGLIARTTKDGRVAIREGGNLLENINQLVARSISTRGTTEEVLRQIKAEVFDPEAPTAVSAGTIRRWMERSENKQILDAYPAIRQDLNDIVSGDTSKLALFDVEKRNNEKAIRDEKALLSFYSFLDPKAAESPATTISKYISPTADNPIKSLNTFFSKFEKAPASWKNEVTGEVFTKEEAIQGFKTALLDAVFINSGYGTNNTAARKSYMQFFAPNPKSAGKVSLMEWAESKGIFSEAEIKDIEELLGKMVEFEGTIFSGSAADVEGLMEKMGPSADLILSLLGSSAGTRLQSLIPGDTGTGSLIAAGRGAEAFRTAYKEVFKSMPNTLKMDLLKEIIKDPEMLANTLRIGKTAKEKSRIGNRMAKYLIDKGFASPARRAIPGFVTEDDSQEVEEPEVQQAPLKQRVDQLINQTSSVAPTAMPAPRPVPAQRVRPPTAALASAAPQVQAPPPPPASGQVNRQQYAALFPNDPTSALIRQQGIGSLMG